jgi:hypothetical protein
MFIESHKHYVFEGQELTWNLRHGADEPEMLKVVVSFADRGVRLRFKKRPKGLKISGYDGTGDERTWMKYVNVQYKGDHLQLIDVLKVEMGKGGDLYFHAYPPVEFGGAVTVKDEWDCLESCLSPS